MISTIICFIIDFIFVENVKGLFKCYVLLLSFFTLYSGKFVFNLVKNSINEIKNLVIDNLLFIKDFISNGIDKIIDKLI